MERPKIVSKSIVLSFISTIAFAQTPETITLTTNTISSGTILTEEAVFSIESPDGNSYMISAGDPTAEVFFKAGEFVDIGEGFEVQEGAELCIDLYPAGDNFAKLKDKIDGSFYQVKNGTLRLVIQEDYFVNNETVSLTIYDQSGNTKYSNTSITKQTGVNGIEIDLRATGAFTEDQFYLVQVLNEKNNPKTLRIKY